MSIPEHSQVGFETAETQRKEILSQIQALLEQVDTTELTSILTSLQKKCAPPVEVTHDGKEKNPAHTNPPLPETATAVTIESLNENLRGRELANIYIELTKRLGEISDGVTDEILQEKDPNVLNAFYTTGWLDKTEDGFVPKPSDFPSRKHVYYRHFEHENYGGPEKSFLRYFGDPTTTPTNEIEECMEKKFNINFMIDIIISDDWNHISTVLRMIKILETYFPTIQDKLKRYINKLKEFEELVNKILAVKGLEMSIPDLFAPIPKSNAYTFNSSNMEDRRLLAVPEIKKEMRRRILDSGTNDYLVTDIKGIGVAHIDTGEPVTETLVVANNRYGIERDFRA